MLKLIKYITINFNLFRKPIMFVKLGGINNADN